MATAMEEQFEQLIVNTAPTLVDLVAANKAQIIAFIRKHRVELGRTVMKLFMENLASGLPPGLTPVIAYTQGPPTSEHALIAAPARTAPATPTTARSPSAPASKGRSKTRDKVKSKVGTRLSQAQSNNAKILSAIAESGDGGTTRQEIAKKTGLPVKYLRSRLNRLIREEHKVTVKGNTVSARYYLA